MIIKCSLVFNSGSLLYKTGAENGAFFYKVMSKNALKSIDFGAKMNSLE
ncbi:MAG: hypothetical protein IPG90_04905 [Bacteroidetes bacterium]|jgi:hypothetical protein|nr:hypothetical protein [Bacteroidota bacterium]MBP6403128.1 hypothetical protein [Bacteroidia bacterium]